jgi:C-terminal processing protease CtpA/Prc
MKCRRSFAFFCVLLCSVALATGQGNLDFERARHKDMLRLVKEDIKKNYFDPQFKGIDLEARYKLAVEKMEKAQSIGQMSGIIAQMLMDFDDSHLFFDPPGKANRTDYGFDFRMAGDKCFVVKVDTKSDAEKVGLQVGDELLSVAGFQPTRETLWKIQYVLYRLRPQPGLNVVVLKPAGQQVNYAVAAKITKGKRVMDLTGQDLNVFIRESEDDYRRSVKQYYYDKLDGVFIWKMPSFSLEPLKVDEIIGRAKKAPALLLDLRGNSGGRVDMMMRFIGNVLEQDVKVADEKTRKEMKQMIAKSRGKDAYKGKIIALIDSSSASASEVFSRVLQLEKRGVVYGDRSAGAVMESRYFGRQLGMDTIIVFGSSITVADLIMKDGKSLEKTGVVPDVTIIPTGKDLAARRDIVLAQALDSLGIKITPEDAGALFPVEETEN